MRASNSDPEPIFRDDIVQKWQVHLHVVQINRTDNGQLHEKNNTHRSIGPTGKGFPRRGKQSHTKKG